MSDPNRPGDVPPDLPPEYADAYRRGYERAYQRAAGEDDEPRPSLDRGGSHRAEQSVLDEHLYGLGRDDRDRRVWLVPALLAGLVVVLLLGAYGVGRVLSDNLAGAQVAPDEPDGVVIGDDGATSTSESPDASVKPTKKASAGKYAGQTTTATIGGASATCESPRGVDSAGNQVRYAPSNVYDQDMTTAWRCDGDGSGQKLTIDLAGATKIGEVGLIPGYAKTDARSGVDRYAENNRLTRVRWVFDDGTSVEQNLDPASSNRELQSIRIPATKSTRVAVQILSAQRGSRNTIAVSELRIGQTAG
ncbi:hypothetical protein BH10ACT10_BH10ACT10_01570 [soil metagenome]